MESTLRIREVQTSVSPSKHLISTGVWNSVLIVAGENMDFDLVSSTLNMQPSVALRKEQFSVPTLSDGVFRHFDARIAQDNWRKYLTTNQSKQPIEVQLGFWSSILHPVRNGIDQLIKLGYWCVIDCSAHETRPNVGSVQFRLSPETRSKLAMIPVDIDFTTLSNFQPNIP